MGNSQAIQKNSPLNIGILGCARIATNALIDPANKLPNVQVLAVASRNAEKAKEFAHKHNIPKSYGSYESLLSDPEIQAVYIPLPNGLHHEWTIKALRAGKHVLCEKPFSNNAKEAEEMRDEALKQKLVLVEAFHWMYHPLAKRMKEIVDGELGKLKSIHASMQIPKYFSYFMSESKATDIRFKFELGGGTMMDAGCYPLSAIRFLSGKEPKQIVSSQAELMYPEVDQTMRVSMELEDGINATLLADFRSSKILPDISVTVVGENGTMMCSNFVVPHLIHSLKVTINGTTRTEKHYGEGTTYWYQLNAFVNEVHGKEKCISNADNAVANMKVIDSIYLKAGLKVRGESKENAEKVQEVLEKEESLEEK